MREIWHIFKKDARQTIALTDGSASNLRTSAWTREAQSNASTPQTSGTEVALQFRTTGVANGTTIACDAAEITIETPSHAVWRSGLIDWSSITQAPDGCRVPVLLPFAGSADQKLRVRASVYFTVFGDEHATAVQANRFFEKGLRTIESEVEKANEVAREFNESLVPAVAEALEAAKELAAERRKLAGGLKPPASYERWWGRP